jgi:D-xylose transport system ATP-binding protein
VEFEAGHARRADRGARGRLIKRLKDHGLAVMVISHNLNDVFEVADRVAILHLGRMVAQDRLSAFDRQSVVDYMTTGASSRQVVGSGSDGGKD